MNRKFSTLMAIAMLATGANGWAQVTIDKDVTLPGNNAYKVQAAAAGGQFSRFIQDNASSRGDSRFPAVSPFKLSTVYGAKPISSLAKVNGTADGRYFQFVVGGADTEGTEVLTMVWVNKEGVMGNGEAITGEANINGKYMVQVENVQPT